MAETFDELAERTTTKKVRERGRALARKYLAQIVLKELRKRRGLSQRKLAEVLHMKQPSLSKLEAQTDMQISTLRKIIEGLGGELVITAEFPDGKTAIKQFQKPAKKKRHLSKAR